MYGDNDNNFIIVGEDSSFEWRRNARKKKEMPKVLKTVISFVLVAVIAAGASVGSVWYYDTYIHNDMQGDVVLNQYRLDSIQTGTTGTVSGDQVTTTLTPEQIYEKTAVSTVLFTCKVKQTSSSQSYPFGYPFGSNPSKDTYGIAYGSGIIMSDNGYIITNAHVVEDAEEMTITLYDGRDYKATLIGSDTNTDIAVVKIEAEDLPAAKFGDSSSLKVGADAYVVGNPLGIDLAFTFTVGHISSVEREVSIEKNLMTLMQIDAAVNPGNSGGPLADRNGYIVGVINAKIASEEVEGIGFAIPINTALRVASDLIKYGYVASRPMLGITVQSITAQQAALYNLEKGVTVTEIQSGSCAEQAGLKIGDKIISFNGVKIESGSELNFQKEKYSIGDTVVITVERDGEKLDITVVLTA